MQLEQVTTAEAELLRALEESLWRAETRFDSARMRAILHPRFIEFGRSGRVYGIEEVLAVAPAELPARLPLPSLDIQLVHADVALVTYESDVAYGSGRERARRSSLWIRSGGSWQLRFHQATPIHDT